MNKQIVLDLKGLNLELLQANMDKEDFPHEYFTAFLRIKNTSGTRKKLAIDMDGTRYISAKNGIDYAYKILPYQFSLSTGDFLPQNSYLDIKIKYKDIQGANNGDRMEIKLKDFAILPLVLLDNQWYWHTDVIEYIGGEFVLRPPISRAEKIMQKKKLKNKIEHFESIDEKFGLTLQNFSFEIIDWNNIKMFCEVIALTDEILEEGFTMNIAIYDNNNDIVYTDSKSVYAEDFKGFDILTFDYIKLDIDIDEISKIRIYPTR